MIALQLRHVLDAEAVTNFLSNQYNYERHQNLSTSVHVVGVQLRHILEVGAVTNFLPNEYYEIFQRACT